MTHLYSKNIICRMSFYQCILVAINFKIVPNVKEYQFEKRIMVDAFKLKKCKSSSLASYCLSKLLINIFTKYFNVETILPGNTLKERKNG